MNDEYKNSVGKTVEVPKGWLLSVYNVMKHKPKEEKDIPAWEAKLAGIITGTDTFMGSEELKD